MSLSSPWVLYPLAKLSSVPNVRIDLTNLHFPKGSMALVLDWVPSANMLVPGVATGDVSSFRLVDDVKDRKNI